MESPQPPNGGTITEETLGQLPSRTATTLNGATDEHDSTITAGIIRLDPYLAPHQDALKRRHSKAQAWIKDIDSQEGGLDNFSRVRPSTRVGGGFGFFFLLGRIAQRLIPSF